MQYNKEQSLLNNLTNNIDAILECFACYFLSNLNNNSNFILKNNLCLLKICSCFKIQLILILIK